MIALRFLAWSLWIGGLVAISGSGLATIVLPALFAIVRWLVEHGLEPGTAVGIVVATVTLAVALLTFDWRGAADPEASDPPDSRRSRARMAGGGGSRP